MADTPQTSRRSLLKLGLATVGGALLAPVLPLPRIRAGAAVAQTPLAGTAIPQFVEPLPTLSLAGGAMQTVLAGTEQTTLTMSEFRAAMLPTGIALPTGAYGGTWVWGYRAPEEATGLRQTYIGPVIVANRNVPTEVRYINQLGSGANTQVMAWLAATDKTMHWADPVNAEANECAHQVNAVQILADNAGRTLPQGDCASNYTGPVPGVPHLHGGEVPPLIDGGPDAWFTSDGAYHGHGYYTNPNPQTPAGANAAVYRYPNGQEAAPLWFHDHALGLTRLNVYAGLAGAYVLVDPDLNLPTGLNAVGLQQGNSGPIDYLVPMVIQDRTFDVDGQLFLHAGVPFTPNPEHPFWVPEFVGDAIVVNGKTWPYLQVEPKRYRFLFINGSNARTYEMFLTSDAPDAPVPPIWQIGTDGGYLDAPVEIGRSGPGRMRVLRLMPGERADVIIDFAGLQGHTLLLRNGAKTPYPDGTPPMGSTMGRIVQFRVNQPFAGPDLSYDPATGIPLRQPMIRLADPAAGTLAAGVSADNTRQLTLNEVLAPPVTIDGVAYPGGPLEVLVNNTKYDGHREDGSTRGDFTPVTIGGVTQYLSELPAEGATEVWELVNLTADAHPIHIHLTQFQVVNRQAFRSSAYGKAYAAAFPGGTFTPGWGPPLDYATGNPRALGGNPDITSYLQGPVRLPDANEAGWKDTVTALPGQVTRIAVRFAPTDKAINDTDLAYPFDPNADGHGYVCHCHIIDHEDNEMMRPFTVTPKPGATRTYQQGADY